MTTNTQKNLDHLVVLEILDSPCIVDESKNVLMCSMVELLVLLDTYHHVSYQATGPVLNVTSRPPSTIQTSTILVINSEVIYGKRVT